jgi:hypothetical protein
MGKIVNLREIANVCAENGVYEFLFCATALPIMEAVGSPINPIALK